MSNTDSEESSVDDIYYTLGRFGIGTEEPGAGLEIDKGKTNDLALLLNSSGSGWGSGVQFKNTAQGGKTYGIYSGSGGLHIVEADTSEKGVDRVVIDGSGNVGIGTATPAGRLTLEGIVQPGQGRLTFFSNTADVEYDGGTDGIFLFRNLAPNGKTAFVGSDIGIGTATPSQRFHVAGGNGVVNNVFLGDVGHGPDWAGFSHASATNPTAYAFLQHSSGQYSLINKRSGGGHIGFRIDNQDKMIMTDDGTLKLLADSNPLWITARWGANPDAPTNVAEISNDVIGYKTLMIVGNRSAGMGRRVSVWDRLEVNGTFVNNSSITTKQDVRLLSDNDYQTIHAKLMETPLYHYRFKADGINHKSRIGVISEESPVEILDETGKYVSLLDYLGFLFVAVKAQAKEIKKLQGQLSSRTNC